MNLQVIEPLRKIRTGKLKEAKSPLFSAVANDVCIFICKRHSRSSTNAGGISATALAPCAQVPLGWGYKIKKN